MTQWGVASQKGKRGGEKLIEKYGAGLAKIERHVGKLFLTSRKGKKKTGREWGSRTVSAEKRNGLRSKEPDSKA